VSTPGRIFEGVTLDFRRLVRFDLPSKAWQAPAAVLECLEEHLLQTFCVLSTDLAERLTFPGRNPTAKEVLDSLGQWEALLRGQQHLSEAGEVGLWGELRFLENLPDVNYGIRAWRGPEGFITDFFGGGVGVECKASRTRLRHHISHEQVGRARDFPVFVVSMWIGTDPAEGQTLSEIIAGLDRRIVDPVLWERLLLKAGYRRSAADVYTARYVLLEAPLWFREQDMPRVRVVDPGVRQLRYVAELDEAKALETAEVNGILVTFCGRDSG
jgi:hypothetical protein